MDLFQVIILGIVEGITEFLPISSTAHLILTSKLMGIPDSNFLTSFQIAIQLGAILSVVFLYRKTLTTNWGVNKKIAAAFLPAAVIGFALYGAVKNTLLVDARVSLWALFIGGILLIVFEMFHKESDEKEEHLGHITYRQSFIIGVFQALAVIPGVSRAGATILGGLWLGLKRKTIIEFSFLLAIPTMFGATALDIYKNAEIFSSGQISTILLGAGISFVVAIFSVSWLLKFLRNHTFVSFGVYRIILAVLMWLVLF